MPGSVHRSLGGAARSTLPAGACRPCSSLQPPPRHRLRPGGPPGPSRWPRPTWPGGVPRPPVERNLGMDYDTEWARRYPARFGRVLVSELVARPGRPAAGRAPGGRAGPHRPSRRAGHLRGQPRQSSGRAPAPVGDPGAVAPPHVRRRRRRLLLRHPAQGRQLRLPASTPCRSSASGSAGTPPTGSRPCWRRAGACSSSPRAVAAPTGGASRTGPARPGWEFAPAGPSCRSTSRAPGRSWPKARPGCDPGTTHVTFGHPAATRGRRRRPAAGRRPRAGRGGPGRRADHRLVDGEKAGGGPHHPVVDRPGRQAPGGGRGPWASRSRPAARPRPGRGHGASWSG